PEAGDPTDEVAELAAFEGLVHVPAGRATRALDLRETVTEGRHEARRKAWLHAASGLDELDSVGPRHPVVREEEVHVVVRELPHRLGGTARRHDGVTDHLE